MAEIYTDEKLRNAIADPCTCYDRNFKFLHLKAVGYPVEYTVTEEQVAKA